MKRRPAWLGSRVWTLLLLALLVLAISCKAKKAPPGEGTASASTQPVVTDASEGLLFTWIDEKGEFHIQEKATDIPLAGRDEVRVVDPANYDGDHPDQIWVADLRVPLANGTYVVKPSTRAAFDALAEERRAKNGTTLAKAQKSAEPEAPGIMPGVAADAGIARPSVIVYGASWCGACHEAAAYLKKKGIAFVEKDIEEDANAAREMQVKLAKSGKRTGSIPVLDVKGKIMVGFNPREVDNALGQL